MRGMLLTKPSTWIVCLLALTWFTCGAQLALADVRDGAGFFKAETIGQANKMIEQLQKKYRKDLIVEAFDSVPKDREAEATSRDEAVKNRFYTEWATQKAESIGDKGIYVLITKTPLHIQVQVGDQTLKTAFTTTDIRNLRSLLADRLKKKNFDEGLIDCVEYVQQAFDRAGRPVFSGPSNPQPGAGGAKAPNPAPAGKESTANAGKDTGPDWRVIICSGLLIVLGFWLVVRMVRRMSANAGGSVG